MDDGGSSLPCCYQHAPQVGGALWREERAQTRGAITILAFPEQRTKPFNFSETCLAAGGLPPAIRPAACAEPDREGHKRYCLFARRIQHSV